MQNNRFETLTAFMLPDGSVGQFHSLKVLEENGYGQTSRLPVSLRILLENALVNCDGIKVTPEHVRTLAGWSAHAARSNEVPFVPARILLQDLNGVPLLADLAAMRDAALALGKDPSTIEPLVPVDMVIDHSVQIDVSRRPDSLMTNLRLEFERNEERYRFMKWGAQAFKGLKVIPPGVGICHQVNLERLATGVTQRGGVYFSDTVVCPDSHTTMINGIGVLGWGVGGIEAEAGMVGQPVFFLTPNVTGVELTGRLAAGITATDVVLTITERLRKEKVVGDFVEFFGDGVAHLSVPTRATIANMAPEYGAFIGFFPTDEATLDYFRASRRPTDILRAYLQAQGLLGIPRRGDIDYTRIITIRLDDIEPSIAGPRRPQDRIPLPDARRRFEELLSKPLEAGGFGLSGEALHHRVAMDEVAGGLGHGDILIAAITSCTNTSNPAVMLGAGLLARNASAKGLRVPRHIKTSLAPGSRAVTAHLERHGLLEPLATLGFEVAAYGCTTCIGNSGPISPDIEAALDRENLVGCAVLSGNRNFEARIHGSIKANYLASPPLVIAFALAGRINIDMHAEPLGHTPDGEPVYLRDIWPADAELQALLEDLSPGAFATAYESPPMNGGWLDVQATGGDLYPWPSSTYLARPPFFDGFSLDVEPPAAIANARALAIFGNSLTTDHISPAGEIRKDSPAGRYLMDHGVAERDFNTYGARRGNHEVMMRGTFANRRIKNLLLPPNDDGSRVEGGNTLHVAHDGTQTTMPIYDAAMRYQAAGTPSIVFGGEEYGTGSARDWAAKGTRLLGIAAVIVQSFERLHRSNLVLMGVLPLELDGGHTLAALRLGGTEAFDVLGLEAPQPQQSAMLRITRPDGSEQLVPLRVRLDTRIEVEYYRHGGIVPYVLRQLFKNHTGDGR